MPNRLSESKRKQSTVTDETTQGSNAVARAAGNVILIDAPYGERMSEVVEHLKEIIAWQDGRYSSNDFADKLDLCLLNANNVLDGGPIIW
jgi:hypothetical protein